MEPHAPLFPLFIAPLSDLYGASNYRVAEAHAYARDLDDLEREELALEQTVRALVDRKAPTPIGLNFHRAHTTGTSVPGSTNSIAGHQTDRLARTVPVGLEAGSRSSATRSGYHGHVAVDDVEAEEDEEEEDEMEEEDDVEEFDDNDEEDDDGGHTAEDDDELFPEGEEDEDDDLQGDDEEEREQSDSMDMSM